MTARSEFNVIDGGVPRVKVYCAYDNEAKKTVQVVNPPLAHGDRSGYEPPAAAC